MHRQITGEKKCQRAQKISTANQGQVRTQASIWRGKPALWERKTGLSALLSKWACPTCRGASRIRRIQRLQRRESPSQSSPSRARGRKLGVRVWVKSSWSAKLPTQSRMPSIKIWQDIISGKSSNLRKLIRDRSDDNFTCLSRKTYRRGTMTWRIYKTSRTKRSCRPSLVDKMEGVHRIG